MQRKARAALGAGTQRGPREQRRLRYRTKAILPFYYFGVWGIFSFYSFFATLPLRGKPDSVQEPGGLVTTGACPGAGQALEAAGEAELGQRGKCLEWRFCPSPGSLQRRRAELCVGTPRGVLAPSALSCQAAASDAPGSGQPRAGSCCPGDTAVVAPL